MTVLVGLYTEATPKLPTGLTRWIRRDDNPCRAAYHLNPASISDLIPADLRG